MQLIFNKMITPAKLQSLLKSRGFDVGDENTDVANNILRFLMLHSNLQNQDLYYKDLADIQIVLKANGIRIENEDPVILTLAIYNIALREKERFFRELYKEKFISKAKNSITEFSIEKRLIITGSAIATFNAVALYFIDQLSLVFPLFLGIGITSVFSILFFKSWKHENDSAHEILLKNITDEKFKNHTEKFIWTEEVLYKTFEKFELNKIPWDIKEASADVLLKNQWFVTVAKDRKLSEEKILAAIGRITLSLDNI